MHDFPTHTVSTRQHWSDDWTERPGLYCDAFVQVASPAIGRASLTYSFGDKTRYGQQAYAISGPLDLRGHYVKVSLPQPNDDAGDPVDPILWYGVIEEESKHRDGDKRGDVPMGAQSFTAYTLDYLLTRETIDRSVVNKIGDDGEEVIGRAIGFNLGAGQPRDRVFIPNCDRFGEKGPVFRNVLAGTQAWTAQLILEYLFAYLAPSDSAGEVVIPWRVTGEVDRLAALTTALHVHGRTIKDVIDTLLDRRRLFGYEVRVAEKSSGPDEVQLYVFNFNAESIVTPSGEVIQPNDQAKTFDFDDDPTAQSPVIHYSEAAKFKKVTARGQRRCCCFTVGYGFDADSLEANWSSADETAYNAGASGGAGYSSLDITEKWDRNQAYRRDDKFAHVYSRFRVPADYDFLTPDSDPIVPRLDGVVGNETLWNAGLRFNSVLPLAAEEDYSGSAIASQTITIPPLTEPLRPFGIISVASGRYQFLDKLNQGDFGDLPESGGRPYSCTVRTATDGLALIVTVSGAPQHVIASNEFTAADADDALDWPADLDWRDARFTVALDADSYVEQSYPTDVPVDTEDIARRLVIEVPDARLDYVAPTTVVGIDAVGALVTSDGGYVRDDRPRLLDIARVAAWWYSQTRVALDVTLTRLDTTLRIGDLITEIGAGDEAEEINSVVTQIAFDLLAGSITISTQYAELDPVAL